MNDTRKFVVMAALVTLLALAMRELFVLATIVDAPIRGDIRDYVAYAWNLVEHGVISGTYPGQGMPVPDAYRSPGYPMLIALAMRIFPQSPDWVAVGPWYALTLQFQVVLGTATVVLVMATVREWLKPGWAIAAGLLLALWPHHVAATGALLSEVTFGFALVLACFAVARGLRPGHRPGWFVLAGVAFVYAWLVNPIVLFFPPFVALVLWTWKQRAGAALLLAIFLVPVVALGVRGAALGGSKGSTQRATVNFVQGSWELYHPAANRFRTGDPIAAAIMQEIDAETQLLERDPVAGMSKIVARWRNDPTGYGWWYLRKPVLLWSWQIKLGANDLYVLKVRNAPLDRIPVLRAVVRAYQILNPLMTALCLGTALALCIVGYRRAALRPAMIVAALAIYVTLIHTVLQAEPRYANAYRPLEAMLVVTALAWLAGRRERLSQGPAVPTGSVVSPR